MIGLDSNLFIYLLEANIEFGPLSRQIFADAEKGSTQLVASELVFFEVFSHSLLTQPTVLKMNRQLRQLTVSYTSITADTLLFAACLRRKNGLGALDAIHVAAAINAGCSQFVTNDRGLLQKTLSDITLVSLTSYNAYFS